jgi:hypothetical protein
MSLQGLPSFLAPLSAPGARLFAPYEGAGAYAFAPVSLALALRNDGRPDFSFTYFRRADGSRPIYAELRFRVAPVYQPEPAGDLLRSVNPSATLRPLSFVGGFLRLVPIGDALSLPASLLAPLPISWDGLGTTSFCVTLSGDSAQLVGGLLSSKTLSLLAYAEMIFEGVAAPLPRRASFDPSALLGDLLAPFPGRLLSRDTLVKQLGERAQTLPISWEGNRDAQPPQQIAETLADWLCARLGAIVPAQNPDGNIYLSFPTEVAPGRFVWDLSQPQSARRALCLSLNPFQALYQLGASAPIDSFIARVDVPPLRFGLCEVQISADVPDGVQAALGLTLHAPANPPLRPAAIWSDEIALSSPSYAATSTLRFSPAEQEPRWAYTLFCDLPGGERYESDERPSQDPARLRIGADEFPVSFFALSLQPRLRALAALRGSFSYTCEGRTFSGEFSLSDAPSVVLCVPKQATDATFQLSLAPLAGGTPLSLSLPAQSLCLDVSHFASYGQHEQTATCDFPSEGGRAVLLEITGEQDSTPTTIRLAPEQNEARFSWYAASPFQPGYRYREHKAAEWSAVQSPTKALHLVYQPATRSVEAV